MGIEYTCGDRGQSVVWMVGGRVCHVSIFSTGLICKNVTFFFRKFAGREREVFGGEMCGN